MHEDSDGSHESLSSNRGAACIDQVDHEARTNEQREVKSPGPSVALPFEATPDAGNILDGAKVCKQGSGHISSRKLDEEGRELIDDDGINDRSKEDDLPETLRGAKECACGI